MTSESRYVMAQVEMPIELKPDNTFISLHEYAKIHVKYILSSKDDIVPPEPGPSIIDQITALYEKDSNTKKSKPHDENTIDTIPFIVHKNDIKLRSDTRHNTTFKSSGRFKHRKSCKLRY